MSKTDYIKNGKRAGCKGYPLNNEEIKRLYLEDNLTLKQIGEKLGVSHWTILSRLKKMGIKKNTRHSVDHNAFNKFTSDSCYWAGFMAADACVRDDGKNSVDVELKYEDRNHLIKLCNITKRDKKLWDRKRKKYGKEYNSSVLSIVSKQIIVDLDNNFSITARKTHTLQPPTNIPKDLIVHFIRGYIDGDGSIGWHKHNSKPRLHICSGSKDLLEWLVDNIKESVSTGNPSIRKEKNRNLHTIEFMGKQVIPILNWLYKDSSNETRLERKYERYKEYYKLLGE